MKNQFDELSTEQFLIYLSKFKPRIDFHKIELKKILSNHIYFNMFLNHDESNQLKELLGQCQIEEKRLILCQLVRSIKKVKKQEKRNRLSTLFHYFGMLKFFTDEEFKEKVYKICVKNFDKEENIFLKYSLINSLSILGYGNDNIVKTFELNINNLELEDYKHLKTIAFYYLIFYYGNIELAKEKIKNYTEQKVPIIHILFNYGEDSMLGNESNYT